MQAAKELGLQEIKSEGGAGKNSPVALPILLADWPRKNNEVIRITLTDFRGSKGLNIRVWYRADSGEFRPTRTGIWLPLEKLSKVRKALRQAEEVAVQLGLIKQENKS